MGIENRPYAGTWKIQGRKFSQYTPDCLVYINGDTSLPGCSKCSGRIDLQQFIINVSVDAGIDAGGASASVSLSIPKEYGSSIFRDNQFIIQPGLEVHIYMRGYFPYKGLFRADEANAGLGSQDKVNLTESVVNPYYHVFHGVIVQASFDYSGGFYSGSFTCSSMLHFWSYQPVSTDASIFGARPSNSKLKASMVGHNYTAMTPFAIIYSLHRDVAGVPSGVGYTMGQKTNVNSVNTINPNHSLYSLSQLYWEKRFSTRINNLRIYGARGTLFNSAQQAFLSKLSSKSADRLVATQYKSRKDWPSDPKDPFYKAIALDMIRYDAQGNLIKPIDVTLIGRSGQPKNDKKATDFGINVAAIHAYVTDIGQFGNVNLFESTYETKLNIAQRVTEVTGFEFFQDVDGDFVFKPPLYNLDTSESRVYRLEPIDIISIAPDAKEPEVTYMVAKGGAFKNMNVGAGLENEWGVSGKYYDWRLVSKFGWKEGSFETQYLNSPREMFYAAVNRLDVMNASINSASATIVLRPEIRPGFPVYVEHLDCYYYVNGINHSFTFGGQCTTSLTLDARRKKFDAPGNPDKEGIGSIDLSNCYLPEKELSVVTGTGEVKTVGFPNVVMALDPTQINPAFFVVGSDVEDFNSPSFRNNIIQYLRNTQNVEIATSSEPGSALSKDIYGDLSFQVTVDEHNSIILTPKGGTNPGDLPTVLTTRDFAAATDRYNTQVYNKKNGISVQRARLQKQLNSKNGQLERLGVGEVKDIKSLPPEERQKHIKAGRLRGQIKDLLKRIEGRNTAQNTIGKDNAIGTMLFALEATRKAYFDKSKSDINNMDSTANILDLLSDKKASFGSGQIPGNYRYYSSSHPNPNDQGQKLLDINETTGVTTGAIQTLDVPIRAKGFVTQPRLRPGGLKPDAEFGMIEVKHGLNILRPGKVSNTERVATRDITELTFVEHNLSRLVETNVETKEGSYQVPKKALSKKISSLFFKDANLTLVNNTLTLGELWSERINTYSQYLNTNFGDYFYIFEDGPKSDFITDPYARYATSETPGINMTLGDIRGRNLKQKTSGISSYFGANFADIFSAIFNTKLDDLNAIVGPPNVETDNFNAEKKAEVNTAYANLKKEWDQAMKTVLQEPLSIFKAKTKRGSKTKKEDVIYTPVFPISDHKGYEVVGSYRYGRGLSIEPGGTLEEVMRQDDPFAFKNVNDVEQFVQNLILKTIRKEEGGLTNGVGLNLELEKKAELLTRLDITDSQGSPIIENAKNPTGIDTTQIDVGLSNWIETNIRSSDKISVTNRAYRLADLSVFVNKKFCGCRAAQADVSLAAFDPDNFVLVDGDLDSLSKYQRDQALIKAPLWDAQQKAYRGEVLERNEVNTFDRFKEAFDPGKSAFVNNADLNSAQEDLIDAGEALDDILQGDN